MINLSMMTEWFVTLMNELFAKESSSADAEHVSSKEARFFERETGDSR